MVLRRILGPLVSKVIMPSQWLHQKSLFDSVRQMKTLNGISIQKHTIASTRGAKIDVREFSLPHKQNQKVIIHAGGNAQIYEVSMGEYSNDVNKFKGTTVVGFNFRNVQMSTGKAYSEDDWVDDMVSIINHYIKKGIKPENILLHGLSLGGAISTMAAAKKYRQDVEEALRKGLPKKSVKSVKVLNDRSFSDLPTEVVSSLLKGFNGLASGLLYGLMILPFFGWMPALYVLGGFVASGLIVEKLPQLLIKPWISAFLWLTFGTMDALSAYKSLPIDAKEHIMAKDDGIIKEPASLHYGLKPQLTAKKIEIRDSLKKSKNPSEKSKLLDELLNIKDSKICLNSGNKLSADAHNYPLNFLQTYHKDRLSNQISGDIVMEKKVRRLLKV